MDQISVEFIHNIFTKKCNTAVHRKRGQLWACAPWCRVSITAYQSSYVSRQGVLIWNFPTEVRSQMWVGVSVQWEKDLINSGIIGPQLSLCLQFTQHTNSVMKNGQPFILIYLILETYTRGPKYQNEFLSEWSQIMVGTSQNNCRGKQLCRAKSATLLLSWHHLDMEVK